MRLAIALTTLVGCNSIYGIEATKTQPDADTRPDIDHDTIADEEDPCIAGPLDRADDADGDGVVAPADACPFTVPSTDSDGDGVDDPCDVNPTLVGDRLRCATRFLDEEVATALWNPRANERGFAVLSGYLIGFAAEPPDGIATSMVSSQTLVDPTLVSYLQVSTGPFELPYELTLWISAGETPSAADVGCRVIATTTGVAAQLTGTNPTTSVGPAPYATDQGTTAYSVGAAIIPIANGANVQCFVSYTDGNGTDVNLATGRRIDGPLQRQGFAVGSGAGALTVFAVYERDAAP